MRHEATCDLTRPQGATTSALNGRNVTARGKPEGRNPGEQPGVNALPPPATICSILPVVRGTRTTAESQPYCLWQ